MMVFALALEDKRHSQPFLVSCSNLLYVSDIVCRLVVVVVVLHSI